MKTSAERHGGNGQNVFHRTSNAQTTIPVNPLLFTPSGVKQVDSAISFDEMSQMGNHQPSAESSTLRVQAFHKRQEKKGLKLYKFKMTEEQLECLKAEQAKHSLKSLAECVRHIIRAADKYLDLDELQLPPITPRTVKLNDAQFMLTASDLAILDGTKRKHGLSRAKVIEAFMLALPDALDRVEIERAQPHFKFNGETAVST